MLLFFSYGLKRITKEHIWMNIGIGDNAKKRNTLRERGNLASCLCTLYRQTDKTHQSDPLWDVLVPCDA